MTERAIGISRVRNASRASRREDAGKPMGRKPRQRDEGREITSGVGQRVRNERKRQALTLEALAERSKVSRAMISKVERSEKSPTLTVLVRISKGLNVTLSSLLGAEPDHAEISITRAGERTLFRDPESGFERELLSLDDSGSGLEILLHRIPARQSTGVLPVYAVPTDKYIVVQEGQLVVHLDDQDYRLSKGDTMHFSVRSPYSFSNLSRKTCVYYVVLVRKQI